MPTTGLPSTSTRIGRILAAAALSSGLLLSGSVGAQAVAPASADRGDRYEKYECDELEYAYEDDYESYEYAQAKWYKYDARAKDHKKAAKRAERKGDEDAYEYHSYKREEYVEKKKAAKKDSKGYYDAYQEGYEEHEEEC